MQREYERKRFLGYYFVRLICACVMKMIKETRWSRGRLWNYVHTVELTDLLREISKELMSVVLCVFLHDRERERGGGMGEVEVEVEGGGGVEFVFELSCLYIYLARRRRFCFYLFLLKVER